MKNHLLIFSVFLTAKLRVYLEITLRFLILFVKKSEEAFGVRP